MQNKKGCIKNTYIVCTSPVGVPLCQPFFLREFWDVCLEWFLHVFVIANWIWGRPPPQFEEERGRRNLQCSIGDWWVQHETTSWKKSRKQKLICNEHTYLHLGNWYEIDAPHVDDVLICIKSHGGGPEKATWDTYGFIYALCGCHFTIAGLETRKGSGWAAPQFNAPCQQLSFFDERFVYYSDFFFGDV